MCGIFGYIGDDENSAVKAIRGIKDLEYRGYDSWGIIVKTPNKIFYKKGLGKVSDISEDNFKSVNGTMALGHTRWATHGKVCIPNTHPHFNQDRTLAVVHNGIVENYQELKTEIENKSKAQIFRSQTDTEVIPHLINFFLHDGISFEEAVMRTCRKLKGRFAFVATHKDYPFIMVARSGSPLVVGIGDGEYFVASDTPAFLDYTQTVNYMGDGECAKMSHGGISFFNFHNGKKVTKENKIISWSKSDASKKKWNHFMIKEIMEQKESLERARNQKKEDITKAVEIVKQSSSVYLVGCGTAAHVCMGAEYMFSDIAGTRISFAHASEFHKYLPFLNNKSLVIPVTQSGETADVLEIIEAAKKKKSKILSIINVRGSSVERESHHFLPINAGPEIAVASTKAATSQMITFLALTFALADKTRQGNHALKKYISAINAWLTKELLKDIKGIAKRIVATDRLFVIGKSSNYPAALEAALKIKEVSYIHAEGLAAAELKHGPIALVEKGTPCIALLANDEYKNDVLNNVEELKARGAFMIGIGPEKNKIFDRFIQVPDIGHASSVVNIIATQILAYYLATLRGLDPDKPRNLAKSVTVK